MQMHRGLRKLFYNLSAASRRVEERRLSREKLHGYLRKIKLVSARTPKKPAIHEEVAKLEKHISEMLDKKLKYISKETEKRELERLHKKEKELNEKIEKLNQFLAQIGKKISKEKLLEQLEHEEIKPGPALKKPLDLEQLESKLYSLESNYQKIKDNPKYPKESLSSIKEKISALKEKIRNLKM